MLPLARVGGSPVAHPPIKQSFNDLYTQLLAPPAPCDVVAQPPRRASLRRVNTNTNTNTNNDRSLRRVNTNTNNDRSFAPPLSPCEELPDELLLRVLERVMRGWDWRKSWCGAVRGVSRQWRAVHDGVCEWLWVHDGVTVDGMHALCGRLPALVSLALKEVTSLTADALCAVGGLMALSFLHLGGCAHVTDAVLRELRGLTALAVLYLYNCTLVTDAGLRELRGFTALTELFFTSCSHVTDVGLQHLTSLTALTTLYLLHTSTTQAGRDALKAALPALSIYW